MSGKIRYWLLPVWTFLFYTLLETLNSHLNPDWHSLMFPFAFLPHILLLLWSYIKGLKFFSLPRPGNTRFIITVLAAAPLFLLLISAGYEISDCLFVDFNCITSEPFYSATINCTYLLCTLLILRIAGLRLPKGKALFMCFLPVLLFAAGKLALIFFSGFSYQREEEIILDMIPERYGDDFGLSVLHYCKLFEYFYTLVIIFFTMYWTMKYNREQAELAASLGSPSGRAGGAAD